MHDKDKSTRLSTKEKKDKYSSFQIENEEYLLTFMDDITPPPTNNPTQQTPNKTHQPPPSASVS